MSSGIIVAETYNYGGALGGYRYRVYFQEGQSERSLLFNARSNRQLQIHFLKTSTILLDFCAGDVPSPGTKLHDARDGIEIRTTCMEAASR